jgi:hypothetical protein
MVKIVKETEDTFWNQADWYLWLRDKSCGLQTDLKLLLVLHHIYAISPDDNDHNDTNEQTERSCYETRSIL